MADNKKRKDGQYLPTTYMDGMLTEWSLTVYIYRSNSQLTPWVGENVPVHVGKEDKQVKHIIMYPHHRNYTDKSLQYENKRIVAIRFDVVRLLINAW